MDIDAVLNKPAFHNIAPEQKSAFKELALKLDGKTVAEAMPIMLSFMASAPKTGPLSPEEQAAMTEAVVECLNEADRARFKSMLSFVKR